MFVSPTIQALEALCNAKASACRKTRYGYGPSTKQIFFFVVVWCEKSRKPSQSLEEVITLALRDGSAQTRVAAIANHLHLWGEAVAGLQNQSAREWLVLGKQMERGVKRYYVDEGMKEDALQTAQIKVWQNLSKLPVASHIEEEANLLEFVSNNAAGYKNLYDFGSPIYNWAKRVASNELGMTIRANKQTFDVYPLEEWISEPSATSFMDRGVVVDGSVNANGMDAYQANALQLQIDLTRLLHSIDDQLTRMQRRVVIYTLSALRANFWLALKITSLNAPADYYEDQTLDTDEKIANKLEKKVNNVRVTRANGCKRIGEYDAILEHLLKILMKKMSPTSKERQDAHLEKLMSAV